MPISARASALAPKGQSPLCSLHLWICNRSSESMILTGLAGRAWRQHVVISLAGHDRGLRPSKLRGLSQGFALQPLSKRLVGNKLLQGRREIGDAVWIDSQGSITGHFRKGGDVARNRRNAACKCLQHRDSKSFIKRRIGEKLRRRHQKWLFLLRNEAGEN